jgi:tetratricopeptide (TPR) repeat protein
MREKSMRLNLKYPPIYLNNLGYTYFLLRRYDEAIAALKRSLSLNPNLGVARVNLAIVYAEEQSPGEKVWPRLLSKCQKLLRNGW